MKRILKDKYEIIDKIEETDKVVVCRARAVSNNKPLIIKLFKRAYSRSQDKISKLTQDTEVQTRLDHPCLLKIYDTDFAGDIFFIAQQGIKGESLFKMVEQGMYLTVPQSINIIMQLGSLLNYAHSERVEFRNIRLSNIIVTSTGKVKVLSFSRPLWDSVKGMDKTRGRSTVQSDVFFLGYILFLLVTGNYPVDSQNKRLKNFAMISPETDDIRWKIDEPAGKNDIARKHLENIIIKAATKNITKRHKTLEKLMKALERHILRFDYNINSSDEDREEKKNREVKNILFTGKTDKHEKKRINSPVKNSDKIKKDPEIEKYISVNALPVQSESDSRMSLIWQSESSGERNIFDRVDPIWLVGIGIIILFLIGLFIKI